MSSDEGIRERVLDAAELCLLESGYTARLHAAIAERAGLSRPTVYKYVGDQTAIVEALLQREVTRFFAATEPVLTRPGPLRERFIETVVFIVGYAKEHALLQKGLRDDPELVVPWFTTRARIFLARANGFFVPRIARAITDRQFPEVDARQLVEWGYRIIASLITTPGTVPVDDPADLRRFVTSLLDIGVPTPAVTS